MCTAAQQMSGSLLTLNANNLRIPSQRDPMAGEELQQVKYRIATKRSCTTERQKFSTALQNCPSCPKIQVYLPCQTPLAL